MLLSCPECGLQISDKASTCPHCGFPLKNPDKVFVHKQSNKRKRLPNGFGQISEIKHRSLRKPFRAMVSVGKDTYGKPICKPLKPECYFETYNDAYAALIEYNKKPYDLSPAITVSQLYEQWLEKYKEKHPSKSNLRSVTSSWKYCSSVYNERAMDIRPRHIKYCMDNGCIIESGVQKNASPSIKSRIKSVFNLMLDYAVEYEILAKNYARDFSIPKEIKIEMMDKRIHHVAFTEEEMQTLWKNVSNINYVDMILIQCYSGWRPVELCELKVENINLENRTMLGGVKTEAGKNRIVPIHSRIYPLIKKYYDEAVTLSSESLFNYFDGQSSKSTEMTYQRYNTKYKEIVSILHLNPDHKAHDPRKQFITAAKAAGVDEYAIKYIVGHAINDVTEKIYTDRHIDWLKEEIEKI